MADEKRPLNRGRLKVSSEPQIQELDGRDRDRSATVGPALPQDKLEVDEIVKLVRTITEKDRENNEATLKFSVALFLFVLAIYAISILLLLALGVIGLPSTRAVAIIGTVLSGVVALLGLLVKSLYR